MITLSQVRFVVFSSIAFALAVTVGCSEPKEPSGDLAGTVLSNGENVGDCVVSLYSPVTKRNIGGKVNDNGEFLIKEIPLGDYNIAILQRTTNNPEPEPFDKRIPAKYRDWKTSGFETNITEGENSIVLEVNR